MGFVNFRFDLDESIEVVYWYVNLLDIYRHVLLFFVHLPKCVGEGRKNDPKHIQIILWFLKCILKGVVWGGGGDDSLGSELAGNF